MLPIDLSGRQVRGALERAGFSFRRQRGSHIILRREDPYTRVVMPDHVNDDFVMAELVPAIHACVTLPGCVDARNKSGHDGFWLLAPLGDATRLQASLVLRAAA